MAFWNELQVMEFLSLNDNPSVEMLRPIATAFNEEIYVIWGEHVIDAGNYVSGDIIAKRLKGLSWELVSSSVRGDYDPDAVSLNFYGNIPFPYNCISYGGYLFVFWVERNTATNVTRLLCRKFDGSTWGDVATVYTHPLLSNLIQRPTPIIINDTLYVFMLEGSTSLSASSYVVAAKFDGGNWNTERVAPTSDDDQYTTKCNNQICFLEKSSSVYVFWTSMNNNGLYGLKLTLAGEAWQIVQLNGGDAFNYGGYAENPPYPPEYSYPASAPEAIFHNEELHLLFREGPAGFQKWRIRISNDYGGTWGTYNTVNYNPDSPAQYYLAIASDGERIYTSWSENFVQQASENYQTFLVGGIYYETTGTTNSVHILIYNGAICWFFIECVTEQEEVSYYLKAKIFEKEKWSIAEPCYKLNGTWHSMDKYAKENGTWKQCEIIVRPGNS